MINRNIPIFFVVTALLPMLGGCVAQSQAEKPQDTRLDQVVSQLDKSLANQAAANAQMQAQQRQLEKQEQNLLTLNANLGEALKTPKIEECPAAVACPSMPDNYNKMIVGGLEKVWFPDLGLALTARIDTGAVTATLDVQEIKQFERDGEPWVRFTIMNPKTETPETLERRLVRTIAIQQSGGGEAKRRPVVRLGIVIGQNEQKAEFGLRNRSHETYQVLIGRSILKDVMVVDVSKTDVAPYVVSEKTPDSDGDAK